MNLALRRRLPYVALAVGLVGLLVGRVLVEGAREARAGDAARDRGDVPDATRHWRRAAHWYLPGSPFVARAYDRLESTALQAESQGRTDHAFAAWRAIRSSALATRWLVIPEQARLERANRHIAALLAEMPGGREDAAREPAERRAMELAQLTQDPAPETAWVLVMGLGFVLWLGGAFWVAVNGWDDADRPRKTELLRAIAGIAIGLALFVVGIARA